MNDVHEATIRRIRVYIFGEKLRENIRSRVSRTRFPIVYNCHCPSALGSWCLRQLTKSRVFFSFLKKRALLFRKFLKKKKKKFKSKKLDSKALDRAAKFSSLKSTAGNIVHSDERKFLCWRRLSEIRCASLVLWSRITMCFSILFESSFGWMWRLTSSLQLHLKGLTLKRPLTTLHERLYIRLEISFHALLLARAKIVIALLTSNFSLASRKTLFLSEATGPGLLRNENFISSI